MREERKLYDIARAAVVGAGGIAMRHFEGKTRSWQKEPGQVVTEADIEIDAFLHQALLDENQDEAWLSEETEDDHRRLAQRRVWVVDPIDGTRSFAKGKPEFTICVALLDCNRPLFGFVFNPATDEMFEARRECGATCNGVSLRVGDIAELHEARIVVSQTENRRRQFDRMIPSASITTVGSLAFKLVLVAAGRFDGYLSWRHSHDWDIAAAHIILEEAGGILTGAAGEPLAYNTSCARHEGLVGAGSALHPELIECSSAAWMALTKS